MSTLNIRVEKYLDNQAFAGSLVARITGAGTTRSISVPVGRGHSGHPSFSRVPLAAGTYLVAVALPSGEVLAEDIVIREGETRDVVLRGAPSPHEWVSWHHFAGSVADEPTVSGILKTARNLTGSAHLPLWKGTYAVVSKQAYKAHPIIPLTTNQEDTPVGRLRISTMADDLYCVLTVETTPALPPQAWQQIFMQFRIDNALPIYVALPVPWPVAPDGRLATVDILVQRELNLSAEIQPGQSSPGLVSDTLRASCVVREPIVGALLAYFSRSDLQGGRTFYDELVGPAEDLLYGKSVNPYAAALSGLFLFQHGRFDRLHDWPRNLANWFPWFPDGAVLHAAQCLHDGEVDEARTYFLAAQDRGVPTFAMSLRLLVNGLSLLANDEERSGDPDPTVDAALARARRWGGFVDFDAPFTTLLASHEELDDVPSSGSHGPKTFEPDQEALRSLAEGGAYA